MYAAQYEWIAVELMKGFNQWKEESWMMGITNSTSIEHVYNIPTMHFFTGISRNTLLKSDIYAISNIFV